jgi:hypothetical protein
MMRTRLALRRWIVLGSIAFGAATVHNVSAQTPDQPYQAVRFASEARSITRGGLIPLDPSLEQQPSENLVETAISPDLTSLDAANLPVSIQPATGPIVILPLNTPNISTEGIGTGAKPENMAAGRIPGAIPFPTGLDRGTPVFPHEKHWVPSAICHKPLYFQDTMLERHGHERFHALQPMISGARFFGTLPLMPYLMTLHPPAEDIYNLGHYRPGTTAPRLFERAPYDARAIGVQTAVTGAGFGLLPL